ncbi:glycosyltransferase [Methylobacterium sp. SD274]|uniref:glycosyltransferase family 4 protein n=1 Tax=Methylobacterium sp. SD274 TaxID=2782009 RepID=UPI001A96FFEF|nr:glycosyltransferase [Methylobacterium sp. SD274]MBO1020886.1 glycosyltransferase [Methylobacterium sp. SD274]
MRAYDVPPSSTVRRPDGGSPLSVRHVIIENKEGYPSFANGIHQNTRSLVTEQTVSGEASRILFLSRDPNGMTVPAGIRMDHVPLDGLRILGRTVSLSRRSREAFLDGADTRTIFHFHGARQPLLVSLTRMLRRRGIPYVISLHACFSHFYDRAGRLVKPSTALYVRLLERRVLEGARFVHVITALEQAELRRLAPKARSVLVPHGVYSSALGGRPGFVDRSGPAGGSSGPAGGSPVFGFCGRLAVFHKGLDLLIEGFALYRRQGGTGRLVVMGPGDERAELMATTRRLGIESAVTFEGPRYGAERDDIVRSWDFFAFPSRLDRWPTAALEAQILGVPLLITAEAGMTEAMSRHGAGLLIEDLTAEAVARSLARAASLDSAEWRAMSRGAHRMGCSADWTVVAARLHALYRTTPASPALSEDMEATDGSPVL